jgi:ATP-binding cassette subfamily B protein
MESIAFVFQDTDIFQDTAENNIRMGNPDASMDDIQNTARAAQADDYILGLPDGYDTVLGE